MQASPRHLCGSARAKQAMLLQAAQRGHLRRHRPLGVGGRVSTSRRGRMPFVVAFVLGAAGDLCGRVSRRHRTLCAFRSFPFCRWLRGRVHRPRRRRQLHGCDEEDDRAGEFRYRAAWRRGSGERGALLLAAAACAHPSAEPAWHLDGHSPKAWCHSLGRMWWLPHRCRPAGHGRSQCAPDHADTSHHIRRSRD